MKPIIHGNKEEYYIPGYEPSSPAYIDSEGNIFPNMAACARFHNVSASTVYSAKGKRPFKSCTLNKPVCVEWLAYPVAENKKPANDYTYYEFLFKYADYQLANHCKVYDELFNKYIFNKIKAHIDLCWDEYEDGWKWVARHWYDSPTIVLD